MRNLKFGVPIFAVIGRANKYILLMYTLIEYIYYLYLSQLYQNICPKISPVVIYFLRLYNRWYLLIIIRANIANKCLNSFDSMNCSSIDVI